MTRRATFLPLVPVLVVPALAGCSLLAGGSGEFTAEGETYKVSKVTCTRSGDSVDIRVAADAAAAHLGVRGTEVQVLAMGAKQQTTMAAQPASGVGSATVTVDGKRYRATGKLVRVEQGQVKPGAGTEEVTFDVTCGSVSGS